MAAMIDRYLAEVMPVRISESNETYRLGALKQRFWVFSPAALRITRIE